MCNCGVCHIYLWNSEEVMRCTPTPPRRDLHFEISLIRKFDADLNLFLVESFYFSIEIFRLFFCIDRNYPEHIFIVFLVVFYAHLNHLLDILQEVVSLPFRNLSRWRVVSSISGNSQLLQIFGPQ